MAHKKGVGSSKNGRDSNSHRLGIKRSDGEIVCRAQSSCVSAAHAFTPAATSASAATTRSMR